MLLRLMSTAAAMFRRLRTTRWWYNDEVVLPAVAIMVLFNWEGSVTFSKRMGVKPARTIQVDGVDTELRTRLWNVLLAHIETLERHSSTPLGRSLADIRGFLAKLWVDWFNRPRDEMPKTWQALRPELKKNFYECPWYEVYDFLEFFLKAAPKLISWTFPEDCNKVLQKEASGYRFIGNIIAPVTSEHEIAGIERALTSTGATANLNLVNTHLKQALALLSDKAAPDYRNSMKESISAVECLCKLVGNRPDATLSPALDAVQRTGAHMHPALVEGFKKLYGYTSDADGIRHALKDAPTVDVEDARYMLVMCAGFVSYLIEKANKAGITL